MGDFIAKWHPADEIVRLWRCKVPAAMLKPFQCRFGLNLFPAAAASEIFSGDDPACDSPISLIGRCHINCWQIEGNAGDACWLSRCGLPDKMCGPHYN